MKVIDKTSQGKQSFDSLSPGDVFKYKDGKIYMKVYGQYDHLNTFDFAGKRMEIFTASMKVEKVESELILYDTELEKMPTVYDVDKVVERLKEESYQHYGDSKSVDLEFAIETIRAEMNEEKGNKEA